MWPSPPPGKARWARPKPHIFFPWCGPLAPCCQGVVDQGEKLKEPAEEWEAGDPVDEEFDGEGADTEWEMDLDDADEVEELIPSASEDEHFVAEEEEERGR